MDTVFLKVLNMSIAAGWLVLAVAVLRLVLQKAPKALRCVLWALVGLRLVLPFSIESAFSLIPSTETVRASASSAPPYIHTGFAAVDTPVNDYLGSHYYEGVTVPSHHFDSLLDVAALLWMVGIAVMLIYGVVSYSCLRRRVRAAMPLTDGLWLCDGIASPFVLGFVKPRICLPSSLEEGAMDYVVAHERAHLKRRDHLWKPLGFGLLALHWFNPLVWVAYILLCRDIELACDERVVRQMDTAEKKAYSEALLTCSMPRRMLAACPLAFGEVGVKKRVKAALHYKKPAFWLIVAAVTVIVGVAVGFLTDPASTATVDSKLKPFIDGQIASHYQSEDSAAYFGCLDWRVLGTEEHGDETTVYLWAMYEEYAYDEALTPVRTASSPTVITVKETDGACDLVEYWTPRVDDVLWEADIKDKFPRRLWEEALSAHRYTQDMHATCYAMAREHFEGETANVDPSFEATVLQYTNGLLLVEPLEGEWERNSAGKIEVSTDVLSTHPVPSLKQGDIVRIVYNGEIRETYPAQIPRVFAIYLVEKGSSSVAPAGGADGPQNVEAGTQTE